MEKLQESSFAVRAPAALIKGDTKELDATVRATEVLRLELEAAESGHEMVVLLQRLSKCKNEQWVRPR